MEPPCGHVDLGQFTFNAILESGKLFPALRLASSAILKCFGTVLPHPTVQILNHVGIEAVRAVGAELQMRSIRMVFRL